MKTFKQYLKESKKIRNRKIEFENIGGGIEVYGSSRGSFENRDQSEIEISGYSYSPTPKYIRKINDEKEIEKFESETDKIVDSIKKACDKFEKEIDDIMKRAGYKLEK